jgi:DNA-binding NarL/FixJ family response regulator
MSVRLVTVDEHVLLRLGLARAAAGSPDIDLVGEAATAAEALAVIARTAPTVVTLDVALPDADGMALAQRLRRGNPLLGVVLLSATADDALLYRALDEGLSGYVTKAAPAATVLSAIRHAAAAPDSFTAPGLSAALARRRSASGLLSHRERQVLALMRDGISLPGIASRLGVSEATVKTYVSRLYTKLGVNNRSQALMAAVNQGLLTYADAA